MKKKTLILTFFCEDFVLADNFERLLCGVSVIHSSAIPLLLLDCDTRHSAR